MSLFPLEQITAQVRQCSVRGTVAQGEQIVKHLVAVGIVANLVASSSPGQGLQEPATPASSKANTETRYLAFQIFTYGPDPKIASMGEGKNPVARFPDKATLRDSIEDIKGRIGTVGDQQNRLAVVLGPSRFDHGDAEVARFIELRFVWLSKPMWPSGSISTIRCSGRSERICGAIRTMSRPWTGRGPRARADAWTGKPDRSGAGRCAAADVFQQQGDSAGGAARSALLGKAIQAGVKRLQKANGPSCSRG